LLVEHEGAAPADFLGLEEGAALFDVEVDAQDRREDLRRKGVQPEFAVFPVDGFYRFVDVGAEPAPGFLEFCRPLTVGQRGPEGLRLAGVFDELRNNTTTPCP
jgi:hypothetical protein